MLQFTILLLVLLPSIAFAEATANPMGDAVASLLTNVVFPIVTGLLTGLVGVILNKIRQKWNLDISASAERMLLEQAKNAVSFAEEKAVSLAKNKTENWNADTKLNMAIQQLMLSAPKISTEQADRLIHTALGMVSGVGATGDKAIK